MSLYIGIMSGTSLDGIDVVVCNLEKDTVSLIAHSTTPYDDSLKLQIESAVNSESYSLDLFCQLDRKIAIAYASAVSTLLNQHSIKSSDIAAIGCHGQTIKHDPNAENGYTLQIGDPNTLAAMSNITVVADFRRKDIALGGQGAPLAPAFHQFVFQSSHNHRAIVNIGGIANITVVPKKDSKEKTIGFDTGPGNTLLDHFCQKHFNLPFDNNGAIAESGNIHHGLLNRLLSDELYFSLPWPKSTGTDYFNLKWYESAFNTLDTHISFEDQLTTLTELSAMSIFQSIQQLPIKIDEIFYCGGGQSNAYLMKRLQKLTQLSSQSTAQLNIHPNWVEALAFAWFAKNTLENKPSNIPSVTSSSKHSILGGIFNA